MLSLNKNKMDISKLNVVCHCEYCNKEIGKGSYHLVLNLDFRYYGKTAKTMRKQKTCMGNIRFHFDCFEKAVSNLSTLKEEIDQLKVALVAKVI